MRQNKACGIPVRIEFRSSIVDTLSRFFSRLLMPYCEHMNL